jgi:hypothetical protein
MPMSAEAMKFVALPKIDQTIRQWLSGVRFQIELTHFAFAKLLALDVALMTPSSMGATAFDRLFKSLGNRPATDIAATGLLRRSQHRMARIAGMRFEDMLTGETYPMLPSPDYDADHDGVVFGRYAITADGFAVAAGPAINIDPSAEAVVRGLARVNGGTLSNPLRCAEALYRHVVRQGASVRSGKPKLPFRPDEEPMDALAAEWAALDGEPGPDQRARIREFANADDLVDALISVFIAGNAGVKRLAAAYRRIATEIVAFMALREAFGSARFSLDRVAMDVEMAIAQGRCLPNVRDLFAELRTQARARNAAKSSAAAPKDLDKLMQRIRALREKTVEQGCTEQEALAAAEKVAQLLDRYDLSLSELDLRKQKCEGIGVETGRKRRGPIDDCVGAVAAFFDCRVWAETDEDGTIRYIFFGMPGDVQASAYLYDLIVQAFAVDTAAFQRGELYGSMDSGARRSATTSFHAGLAHGIADKLQTLRLARDAARDQSGGRALVPVKQSLIDEELEQLGLSLRFAQASRRRVVRDAYGAGKEAGEKFEYRAGIEAG